MTGSIGTVAAPLARHPGAGVLMLSTYFPQDWRRYQSVPILGPVMNRYASWLDEQQYTWRSARYELRMADRVAGYFSRRGLGRIEDLEPQHLHACHRWF